MRKLVSLAALAIIVLTCSESQASNRRVRTNGYQTSVSSNQGSGPFARLMDMERRKNAALRQMFFGR